MRAVSPICMIFARSDELALLAQILPSWAEAAGNLGSTALVILGFGLFIYGLFSDKIVTGGRFQDMQAHYEKLIAERDAECAALKTENQDQHRDIVRANQEIGRLAENYNRLLRDLIMAKLVGPTAGSGDES